MNSRSKRYKRRQRSYARRNDIFFLLGLGLVIIVATQYLFTTQAKKAQKYSGEILFISEVQNLSDNIFLLDFGENRILRITDNVSNPNSPGWAPSLDKVIYSAMYDSSPDIDTFSVAHAIYIFDLNTRGITKLLGPNAVVSEPSISPNGEHIAFVSTRETPSKSSPGYMALNSEIFIMDIDGSDIRNLTDHTSDDRSPTWSPDGKRIAFVSNRDGNQEIYIMDTDGNNQVNISNNPGNDFLPSWSPDGRKIAFVSDRDVISNGKLPTTKPLSNDYYVVKDLNYEIYLMNTDGSEQVNISNHPMYDSEPDWHPDGEMIAFVSNRDGTRDIFIMNIDGSNQINVTNRPEEDYSPSWKPE